MDAIDFILAEKLGMSLGQIGALPSVEVEAWRAYITVRRHLEEFEAQKASEGG